MKRTNKNAKVIYYRPKKAALYPNVASRREQINRMVDYVLTAATSAGFVTILLCLFTFF